MADSIIEWAHMQNGQTARIVLGVLVERLQLRLKEFDEGGEPELTLSEGLFTEEGEGDAPN